MNIQFLKMHGTLNDFVVLNDLSGKIAFSPAQVAVICDRHAGVGADGLIVVRKSRSADFFMDYMNSDGSIAEMCGNGIRCLAKYAFDNGLTNKTTLQVETRAGIKTLELFPGSDGTIENVRVEMGEPVFAATEIPVNLKTNGTPIIDHPVEADGVVFQASILSMGNPHCVIVLNEDVSEFPQKYGPTIESLPMFPQKTNVEFVHVINRSKLLMRVWERGSGETFACGTGACAAMVAANLKGLVDQDCTIALKGGELSINWKGFQNSVLMTGSVVTVFKGEITI
jgi:diaminopimelate epimerase